MILIVDILPLANYCYSYFLLIFECRIVNCHLPLYPSLPFTSIKLSSGDLTDRNTNFILGQHLDILSSFTIFDLCADRLSSYKKDILNNSYHHTFYLLFLESQQTVLLSSFYSIVHASCHFYGHTLQTHLVALLSSVEPSLSLPAPRMTL